MRNADDFNVLIRDYLPGHLGIMVTAVDENGFAAELPIVQSLMAPNGYLHAGSIITLADSCCGLGCVANLPAGATGFTTIELKSNHLGTAREGTLTCTAAPFHKGRTTQVWDAQVQHKETAKTIALFRCTQLILYNNT